MSILAQKNKLSLLFGLLAAALTTACAEPPINNAQMAAANNQADLYAMKSSNQEIRQRLEELESRLGRQGQGGASLEDLNARLTRLEATVGRMAATLGVDTSAAGPVTSGPAASGPVAAQPFSPGMAAPQPQSQLGAVVYDSGSDADSGDGYGSPQAAAPYQPANRPYPAAGTSYQAPGDGPYPSAANTPSSVSGDQAESVYRMAEDAYNQRDMARAATLLEQLVKSYPSSPRVPDALYWQAQANIQQGDYGKAALVTQDLIQKYPTHPRVPSAMLTQSLAFRKLGKAQAAQTVLQDVIKRFPDTPEARSAQAQLRTAQ